MTLLGEVAFSTTFLGHQGWMFRAADSCILVDPLLGEEFGHAHALEYRVYPPREFAWAAFPRVDGVVLTHEHDDHFDIPSLARLDRSIPIYLSARSSSAAYEILAEMGFSVQPLVPGASIQLGCLEVYPLVGNHIALDSGDEWDALPFVVRDTNGDGSFFSGVDVAVTRELIEGARRWCAQPGLVGWTNNTLDRSHMTSFLQDSGDQSAAFARSMQNGRDLLSSVWTTPAAMLLCGGGFSFHGARAWLNHRFFCVDGERVVQAMQTTDPEGRYFSVRPGQTFHLRHNTLVQVDHETPFLKTKPRPDWPSREKDPESPAPDYTPATERQEMTQREVGLLRERLQDFADALAGSLLFRGLYSLLGVELAGYRCTFALVLRHGSRAAVFEYSPNACAFVTGAPTPPKQTYIAGMSCWATDLLAVLSGELSPIALSFARASLWNHIPDRLDFDIFRELYRLSHPLRRPIEYHALYRRLMEQHVSESTAVRARRAPPREQPNAVAP